MSQQQNKSADRALRYAKRLLDSVNYRLSQTPDVNDGMREPLVVDRAEAENLIAVLQSNVEVTECRAAREQGTQEQISEVDRKTAIARIRYAETQFMAGNFSEYEAANAEAYRLLQLPPICPTPLTGPPAPQEPK